MKAGYTGTPLAKKLGIKQNYKVVLYHPPENYFDLLSDIPNAEIIEDLKTETVDFIHMFCRSFDELNMAVDRYKNTLKKNGMLWVSWPKGASKFKTDLKRDMIREHLLKTGLVDVKVAAIDENWSGLKFVYRLEDR